MSDRELTRNHYDDAYGRCEGFPHTEPKLVRDVGTDARIDGLRTYTVQTFRAAQLGGDFHFIEITSDKELIRVCLPPKVAVALAQQCDALAARAKRAQGKRLSAHAPRPPKGVVPPQFARKARKK